jgi:hypothetical protein
MNSKSHRSQPSPNASVIIRMAKRAGVTATVLVLGAAVALPAIADRAEERLVYTWACDWGPENLPVSFADPTGRAKAISSEAISSVGLAVSPDGTRLALTHFDGLVVASADGSGGILVTDSSITGEPSYPTWSPSGKHLAFVGAASETSPITLVDLDSLVMTPLPADVAPWDGLHWSPDGQKLVWSANGSIGTVDVEDGSVEMLGAGFQPRYSPDGTRIAFVTTDGLLATMTPDGQTVWKLDQAGSSPVWSPDGKRLGFVDRITVGDFTTFYIGVYSLETHTVSVVVQGGEVCDDNLYLWDWAVLQWPTFADIPFDHLFHEDIEWAWTSGVTKGCNPPVNDRFCPDDSITRGQMAAFLNRALGFQAAPDQGLVDTEASEFADDIDAIYAAGITRGCNPPVNDRFCPDDPVTRGQMAAFLSRALR